MNQNKKIVAFCSLGCKVNQYETNAMMQEFINTGYIIGEFEKYADIYIVNTCTVTNVADRKSRQMLRRVKELNPNAIVVACGCYAQVGKQELEKVEQIDIIIGNNEKKDIVKLIEEKSNNIISDVLHQKEYIEFGTTTFTEKTRAVVKVQDGCDRFCSYCIIPYARGRVRSRKLENVVQEVEQIVKEGIKEVVITGIHIASYGKDFEYKVRLINLLEELNKIEGLQRIRLGSLEPTIITEEFVERLSKLEKICDHFHLSLQSGCNDILSRMNRKYTTEEFKITTEVLRKYFLEAALTTDIIVGFPGETKEDFEITYNYLKEIKFYKMHVFKYSQRKGTKAAIMQNQIDGKLKDERSKKIIELSDKNELDYNKNDIGKKVEVLFEEQDGEYYKGHTKNYKLVKVIATEEKLENQIKLVEVIDANKEFLLAK